MFVSNILNLMDERIQSERIECPVSIVFQRIGGMDSRRAEVAPLTGVHSSRVIDGLWLFFAFGLFIVWEVFYREFKLLQPVKK